MKKIFFAVYFVSLLAQADCLLYKDRYGYELIGRVEDRLLYQDRYGYTIIGHFEDNLYIKTVMAMTSLLMSLISFYTKTAIATMLLATLKAAKLSTLKNNNS